MVTFELRTRPDRAEILWAITDGYKPSEHWDIGNLVWPDDDYAPVGVEPRWLSARACTGQHFIAGLSALKIDRREIPGVGIGGPFVFGVRVDEPVVEGQLWDGRAGGHAVAQDIVGDAVDDALGDGVLAPGVKGVGVLLLDLAGVAVVGSTLECEPAGAASIGAAIVDLGGDGGQLRARVLARPEEAAEDIGYWILGFGYWRLEIGA